MVAKLFILGENFDHLKIFPTGKYSSKVTLDIKAENGRKSITVKDDGCGMDEENLQNKFLTVDYQRRKTG